jgi:hypothetical protein
VIAAQNIMSAGLAATARGGASGSGETGTTPQRSRLLHRLLPKGIPVLQGREDVKILALP